MPDQMTRTAWQRATAALTRLSEIALALAEDGTVVALYAQEHDPVYNLPVETWVGTALGQATRWVRVVRAEWLDLLKALPGQQPVCLTLRAAHSSPLLWAAAARAALPAEVIPPPGALRPEAAELHLGTIPAGRLVQALCKLAGAMGAGRALPRDPAGLGVLIRPGEFVFTATDGFRLGRSRCAAETSAVWDQAVVWPRPAVSRLARLLGEQPADMPVQFFLSPGLSCRWVGGRVDAALDQRIFPDYAATLPREPGQVVALDHAALNAALDAIRQWGTDHGVNWAHAYAPPVRLTLQTGVLSLRAETVVEGETRFPGQPAECRQEFAEVGPGRFLVAYAFSYLAQVVAALDGPVVYLEVREPTTSLRAGYPPRWQPQPPPYPAARLWTAADPHTTWWLMPMMIDWLRDGLYLYEVLTRDVAARAEAPFPPGGGFPLAVATQAARLEVWAERPTARTAVVDVRLFRQSGDSLASRRYEGPDAAAYLSGVR